ncbi:MAG: M14 family metallocarboxypeptidase [Desulfobacterales bacterium]|jgi:hypothetical protein
MTSAIKFVTLCISTLSLFACASGHHAPFTGELALVRKIAGIEKRLEKAVLAVPFFSMRVIGIVRYDIFQAPIWVLTIDSDNAQKYGVLISAGVHGNEPAGVESILRFVETLANDPAKYKNFKFHILPLVNPWGWSHNNRFNKDGIDINRDFASLKSQEAAMIQQFMQGKKYDLMIDLHEDPSAAGFYLYQYGRPDDGLCRQIITKVKEMGYPVEQNVNMVILNTKDGLIDAPMWGLRYMRLTRQLSITNYYRLNNSKNVFTIETPTTLPMKDRLSMQTNVLDMFLDSLIE